MKNTRSVLGMILFHLFEYGAGILAAIRLMELVGAVKHNANIGLALMCIAGFLGGIVKVIVGQLAEPVKRWSPGKKNANIAETGD